MENSSLTWLPFGFQDWTPLVQAIVLGLLTFVQEDIPTVSAALLSAQGSLLWPAGFVGCFLGIWVGDALLYWLARGFGRPLLKRRWARRAFDPEAVARSERWFAQRGTWLLLSSRFVPGTRLPTYLAAGFLCLPFGRFLLVTGLAVAIWTSAIFGLARIFGTRLFEVLQRWNAGGWALLVAVILGVLLVRLTPWLAQRRCWLGFKATIHRWWRWEFWPPWLFYGPVAIHYLRLAFRYGGFTLPTAANPGIFSGGFVGESKIATLREMARTSPEFTAEAFLLPAAPDPSLGAGASSLDRFTFMEKIRAERSITMPFILKPDMGQRGVGVKLIRSLEQAAAYLRWTRASLVIQRYAPGPNEVGIFYYRFPGQPRGRIFAITEKIFPTVTGDGQSSLEELIWQDPRARIVAQKYLRRLAARRHAIPALGEVVKLVEAGNHAQGCIFQEGMHLWSEELENRIDEISQKLDGFFIGRYDVRYSSLESLRQGKDFLIIELNGASAEATSIYDARHSLTQAYRTLFRQWELVFAIGAANRQRGWMPTRLPLLWRKWRENTALVATYPLAD